MMVSTPTKVTGNDSQPVSARGLVYCQRRPPILNTFRDSRRPHRSQATVLTITEGQLIELDELVLPPKFIERTLNGIVVNEDGTPEAGAVVWLKERQYQDSDMPYRRETDSEGRFSYPVYEGIKYSLTANVDSDGKRLKHSAEIEIVITSNTDPIKIVLKKAN